MVTTTVKCNLYEVLSYHGRVPHTHPHVRIGRRIVQRWRRTFADSCRYKISVLLARAFLNVESCYAVVDGVPKTKYNISHTLPKALKILANFSAVARESGKLAELTNFYEPEDRLEYVFEL